MVSVFASKALSNSDRCPLVGVGESAVRSMLRSMASLVALFLFSTLACGKPISSVSSRLYVNYSAKPDAEDLVSFDLCILDPDAQVDLAPGHAMANNYLAYISTVEIRPETEAAKRAVEKKIPILGKNKDWGSELMDVTHPAWQSFVVEDLAAKAIERGFDGFFLDTLDSAALIADGDSEKATKCQRALIQLIGALRERFPSARIVLNRGFDLLDQVSSSVNGVLIESVYQTFDAKTGRHHPVSSEGSAWLEAKVRKIQSLGLPVYAVDYVTPTDSALANKTAAKLTALGCIPFITTPALDGTLIAPLRAVARRVLVLYGWDPAFADKPATWPIDTMTAEHLQTTLEWMGYEVEYLDVGKKPLPSPLPSRFAGIILDEFLKLSPEQERPAAEWLVEQKDRSVPILFTGDVPFTDDTVKEFLSENFGFTGTLRAVHGVKKPSISKLDGSMMNAEADVTPISLGFKDITAPPTAEVFVSVLGEDKLGNEARFDAVFLAPWGGVWLEPYVVKRASQENRLFYADPFKLLVQWLKSSDDFPVPDVTTQDGKRLFYSHIDGDGFASLTHFPGHPTCAEVIRSKILQRYPLPVTVSIVEADTRAHLKTLKLEDSQRYENIARSLFALPNVQAASHSYTHPFAWDPTDPNPGHFDRVNVPLNETIQYPQIDLEREIKGSIDYINETLLPKDKKVELMLWSGNCRPGVRALQICREAGVENMNGGDTIISRMYPGLSGVAPRTMPWGDEIQIFAANQNEFMYANGFQGPFFGGFANVIDTFERTETPRRLKPVNVYYHFYSSTFLSSMRALEKIHDWCMEQPLHPITALQYASIVRDAARSKIYSIAPDHWLIANTGKVRTLRVPTTSGVPDLTRCKGVSGFKTEGPVTYIHTMGKPTTELFLTDASSASDHLRLVDSTAPIQFHELTELHTLFKVSGWTTAKVTFGGMSPETWVTIKQNKEPGRLKTDALGQLTLTLPANSTVSLTVQRPPYAAAN